MNKKKLTKFKKQKQMKFDGHCSLKIVIETLFFIYLLWIEVFITYNAFRSSMNKLLIFIRATKWQLKPDSIKIFQKRIDDVCF